VVKICRLPKNSRNTVINANIGDISDIVHSQVPSHHVQQKHLLELKPPNWKEWAFKGGSCITTIEIGSQYIGAGVYLPQPNKTTTVNPGGTSIKNHEQSRASRKYCCLDISPILQQAALVHYGK